MKVSIVIVNYNTPEYTSQAVRSIFQFTKTIDFEVIVVDNGSKDNRLGVLLREFPQVRLLRNEINLGFSKGNNIALTYARGQYLTLLNSDAFISNDAIGELCKYMDEHPNCGVVGAQLVAASGEIHQSIFKIPTATSILSDLIFGTTLKSIIRKKFTVEAFNYKRTQRVGGAVSGACVMVRRELVENGVLLDPNYFFGLEDVDLCYSAMKKGWEIHYCAEAQVVHVGGASKNTEEYEETIRRKELYWRSVRYFFSKHHNSIHSLVFRILVGGSFALKWILRSLVARVNGDLPTMVKAEYNRRVALMLLASIRH